jgi:hypothetical protein
MAMPSAGNPACRATVAGDHHDPDAGRTAFGDGLRHFGPHRVFERDQPEKLELEVMLIARQHLRFETGARDAEHAQPVARHGRHLGGDAGALRRIEVAQIDDGLRRALRRDHPRAPVG